VPERAPRGERYEQRRQEVIDAAARVFAQRGYHATTVDDLVEATGLQRGGLYHYIGGKLELLIACHERFIEPLLEDARAVAAADQPPDRQIRAIAAALMGDIASYRDQVTVFLHEWRIIESEPAWQDIRAKREEFEQIVVDILERGRAQGVFAFDDARLTVLAFLGMINYSYQWYDLQGRVTPEQVAEHFATIFLDGVARRR
jgi:AcrR family transcriptional regulator